MSETGSLKKNTKTSSGHSVWDWCRRVAETGHGVFEIDASGVCNWSWVQFRGSVRSGQSLTVMGVIEQDRDRAI